jgi:hypothetical protein
MVKGALGISESKNPIGALRDSVRVARFSHLSDESTIISNKRLE